MKKLCSENWAGDLGVLHFFNVVPDALNIQIYQSSLALHSKFGVVS